MYSEDEIKAFQAVIPALTKLFADGEAKRIDAQRDHIALEAMKILLVDSVPGQTSAKDLAESAYLLADAMLDARETMRPKPTQGQT